VTYLRVGEDFFHGIISSGCEGPVVIFTTPISV
jgi:hypothetical protein